MIIFVNVKSFIIDRSHLQLSWQVFWGISCISWRFYYNYEYLERQTYKIHNHTTLTAAVLSEPHFKWIIIIIIIIIPYRIQFIKSFLSITEKKLFTRRKWSLWDSHGLKIGPRKGQNTFCWCDLPLWNVLGVIWSFSVPYWGRFTVSASVTLCFGDSEVVTLTNWK